jgi:hypothetical protein
MAKGKTKEEKKFQEELDKGFGGMILRKRSSQRIVLSSAFSIENDFPARNP